MRRPDSDGKNRLYVGERHPRKGSSNGAGGTQTRVRVHGSEDGRTTVTLECPDAVLDVPAQLGAPRLSRWRSGFIGAKSFNSLSDFTVNIPV